MGDCIVIGVLVAVVYGVIRAMIKNKKQGKSCCGSCDNCSGCHRKMQ